MSRAEKFLFSLQESKSKKNLSIKYTTTKSERELDPKDLAKKKFNIANGSYLELATMGGHLKAQVIRAQMAKNKKDEKYYQEVLDKFDNLFKRKEKKDDETRTKSR